jgi:benzodiazapine receptor
MPMIKSWPKLLASIIACILIGSSGSIFTMPKIATWYATLQKPWFTPPQWAFGPVWITLFTLMGISFYLIWQKGFESKPSRIAAYVFAFQFALNVLWSLMFFGLESPFLGLVFIIALWISIASTIFLFRRVSKQAAYLLIPYICWVSIALALNYYVMILN